MSASWYDRHLLPHLVDFACGMQPVRRQREMIVPLAHGRVLEVGIGTGLNMPFYDPSRVRYIVGVDPALQMHRLASKRIARAGLDVELVGISAETLPLEDESIDTIVTTYTLCTIPDPVAALREMRRVLAPGGRLRARPRTRRQRAALAGQADTALAEDRRRLPSRPRHFGAAGANRIPL